jgi:hypothetical protein
MKIVFELFGGPHDGDRLEYDQETDAGSRMVQIIFQETNNGQIGRMFGFAKDGRNHKYQCMAQDYTFEPTPCVVIRAEHVAIEEHVL